MIRIATINDAESMAIVHVASWRSTYAGLIPDDYLAQLSVDQRKRSWEWTFHNLNPDEVIYVFESEAGEIIGFVNGGRDREKSGGMAELYAIYLLQDYQRQGIGKRLVHQLVHDLHAKGYSSLRVWVLKDNPAKHFYEAMGGEELEEKEIEIGGQVLLEVALKWDNMEDLLKRTKVA